MLAGRLARIVEDILREFQEFQVVSLLNEAINLATNRPNMSDAQYVNQAQQLCTRAQEIIDKSFISKYPPSLQDLLLNSQYALFLPTRIANVIINGFPDQKASAISSAELQIYLNNSNSLLSELNATRSMLDRLGIRKIVVPDDNLSLDVAVPRTAFSDSATEYIDTLRPFVSVMTNFIELASGSRTSPLLVYASTTDPTTGLALIPLAAWGVLKFYKLLLEIAEKQISLIKSIKTLRESGINPSETSKFEEHASGIVDNQLRGTAGLAAEAIPGAVPPERVAEIKVAIEKDARATLEAVVKGTRISVTLESMDKLVLIPQEVDGLTVEQVSEQLAEQQKIEQKIVAAMAIGIQIDGLLPRQQPPASE